MSSHMQCFVIYDSLYDEYQNPFFIKNEYVARVEFDAFVRKCVEQAPEKEKVKTANRFHLFSFPISFDRENCMLLHLVDINTPPINIKAEPVAKGVEIDE